MDYQSGINPDWCACPNWKRTTLVASLFICVLISFFRSWHEKWNVSFFLFALKPLLPPASPSQDVRRSLREAFIHSVHSLKYLPPLRLFAWLAAELTWLPGWLAPFLTGLSHAAWAPLRQGWRETAGLLSVWKVGSLRDFPLCLVWWTIRWEQGKSVATCHSAQTIDCHYCAASMTLHTWLVYGFGFILVWTLCFARGRWDALWYEKMWCVFLM